jgi:hypothetical protein
LLQVLLLLLLISLPPNSPSLQTSKEKKKSHKDPERHAESLDPELLLDFLTDRIQISRVMRDFSAAALAAPAIKDDSTGTGKEKEDKKDLVHDWWNKIVLPTLV